MLGPDLAYTYVSIDIILNVTTLVLLTKDYYHTARMFSEDLQSCDCMAVEPFLILPMNS